MSMQRHSTCSIVLFCLFTVLSGGGSPLLEASQGEQVPKPDLSGVPEDWVALLEDSHAQALKNPDDPAKLGEYATVLLRLAKLNAAIECLQQTISKQPGEMRWHYYLGIAREQMLDTKPAIEAFRKCLEINPEYPPTLVHLGDLLLFTDAKEAESCYIRARALSPEDPRVYFGLGECARLKGDSDTALKYYKTAVEKAPQYASAHGALCRLYEARGDQVNADIHRTAEKKGRDPKVVKDPLYIELMSTGAEPQWLLELSSQLIQAGDFDLAARFIARAGTSKQFAEEANKQLGLLNYMRHEYAPAVDYLTKYLAEIRGDHLTRIILARAMIALKRHNDAERELKIVTNGQPENIEALELLAMISSYRRRPEAAVANLQKVIRLDPRRKTAHIDLIVTQVLAGNDTAAIEAYKPAVKLFNPPELLDYELLVSLLSIIRDREISLELDHSFRKSCLADFSAALDKAGRTDSAARVANYMQTISQGIDTRVSESNYAEAFHAIDRMITADEGGCIRDAMSRTIARFGRSFPGSLTTFFTDNARKAENEPSLATILAWIRATSAEDPLRNAAEAVRLAELADRLTGHKDSEVLDTLAAAYAESGDFDRAVSTMKEALKLADASGLRTRIERLSSRLALYEKKTPYRH